MNLRPIDANRQAMFQPILKCAGEYRLAPFSLLLRGRGPAFHVPAFQRNHRKRLAPFFLERCCSLVPRSHVSSRSLYRSLRSLSSLRSSPSCAKQAPLLGCCGLRSSGRPFRRIDRSTLELREDVAILWRSSTLFLLRVHYVHSTYRSLRSLTLLCSSLLRSSSWSRTSTTQRAPVAHAVLQTEVLL